MNATGLPIPTAPSAASPVAGETTPLMSSGAQAPTDFVLALAQMLGASVPASNVTAQATAAIATSEDEPIGSDVDAASLALLPMPIAQLQTQLQPQDVARQVAEHTDLIESLGLAPRTDGPSARDVALLQALTERLAGIEETPAPQVQSGSLNALEGSQPRAAVLETAPHSRPLQHPVGTRAWADELGTRLTLMTDKGQHTASIRLSPEHLGPLEIRIAMRDDQASVWFGAAHADTRAAIEHALPRLRELFAAEGMSLADAGVFREPPKQAPTDVPHANNSNEPTNSEAVSSPARVQIGLLDAYA